jgi:predicted nucleic acid-binding protein
MILADTSIWVDHLRDRDSEMVRLLEAEELLGHPAVRGELGLGSLRARDPILLMLGDLPQAVPATDDEVLRFIGRHRLAGRAIGWVDAHLLASVALTPGARLWTRDRRLSDVASGLSVGANGLSRPH